MLLVTMIVIMKIYLFKNGFIIIIYVNVNKHNFMIKIVKYVKIVQKIQFKVRLELHVNANKMIIYL